MLWRDPHGKAHALPCVCAILKMVFQFRAQSSDDYSSSCHVDYNIIRDPES
jgi:hypothetical protein